MAVPGSLTVADPLWTDLLDRLAPVFPRIEPRRQAVRYLTGLLGDTARKNGRGLADYVGDGTPWRMQRLMNRARWDADLLRDVLRDFVAAHCGAPGGVLCVGEMVTGKRGSASVGVGRQFTATTGRLLNCQVAPVLAYASRRGAALVDRELYLPPSWDADPGRRARAGVPDGRAHVSRSRLVRSMIARAGLPFAWVTGDDARGCDAALRDWLERCGIAYVIAAPPAPGGGVARPGRTPGYVHRSLSGAAGHFVTYGPVTTPPGELAAIAARHDTAAVLVRDARERAGLDAYEVRGWTGWHRHVTLALLATAYLRLDETRPRTLAAA